MHLEVTKDDFIIAKRVSALSTATKTSVNSDFSNVLNEENPSLLRCLEGGKVDRPCYYHRLYVGLIMFFHVLQGGFFRRE